MKNIGIMKNAIIFVLAMVALIIVGSLSISNVYAEELPETEIYHITYDLDGGEFEEGMSNPEEYTYGTTDFVLAEPTKEGYKFLGWNKEGDEKIYRYMWVYTGARRDLHFIAHWEIESYIVYFDTMCSLKIDNQSSYVVYGDYIEEPDEDQMIRFGYEFDGWYADDYFTEEWDFDAPITGETLIIAKWNPLSYDIDDDGEDDFMITDAYYYGTSLGVDWIIFRGAKLYLFGEQDAEPEQESDWGWHKYQDHVKTVYMNFDSDMSLDYLFAGCSELKEINYNEYSDISECTSLKKMFYRCSSLFSIDVAQFGFTDVEDISGMFEGCTMLQKIIFVTDEIIETEDGSYVGGYYFDTSEVVDCSNMFARCSWLRKLDISTFDLENAECVDGMFKSCRSLQYLATPFTGDLPIELPFTMYDWDMYNEEYTAIPANAYTMELHSTIDERYHNVSIYASEHGTVEINTEMEREGDNVYFEATPDEGYEIDKFDSAEAVDVERMDDGRFTFIMPDKDVTIQVVFREIKYEEKKEAEAPKYLEEKVVNEDGTYTFNLVKGQKYPVAEFRKIPKTTYKIREEKSDKKIASINAKGIIAAKKAGTAKIDLLINNKIINVTVNVYEPRYSVKKEQMKVGESKQLDFDAKGFSVSYSIAPKQQRFATVDAVTGVVSAKAKGKVCVIATVNGKQYKINVKIIP